MTPLTLHLQYFGPYRDATIDFTKFASTPLFLISGKTGSGKTTIFDGMCYALFNQTSGIDREPKAMRSDFATFDDQTQVTFTFSHRDKHYEIVRAPEQTLHKKRGDGVTNVAASVTLTVWDGTTEVDQLTKAGQVQDYLGRLLQMDAKQFAQIVLLPQGQFRRFLVAPSDEKATVLEQLFNTELFGKWSDKLVDQLRESRTANKAALTELHRLQTELTWDQPNQATAAELIAAQKTTDLLALMATQQATTQAAQQQATTAYQTAQTREQALTRQDTREEQLLNDRQQLTAAQAQQQALAGQTTEMATLQNEITELDWTQTFQPTWQTWQRAQTALKQRQQAVQTATQRLTVAQTADKAAQEQQASLTDLQQSIAKWQQQQVLNQRIRPVYEQITATQTKLTAAQGAMTQATATVTTTTQQLQVNQTATSSQQAIIAGQSDLYAKAQELAEQAATLHDWQQQATRLQQQAQANQAVEDQLTVLTPRVNQAQSAAESAQQVADDRYQLRLRHQIAELSAQLTPGSPCPVCGSTEHPVPAPTQVAGERVSAEAVRTAQTTATQAQRTATELAAEQTQLTQKRDQNATEYQTALTKLRQVLQTSFGLPDTADEVVLDRVLQTALRENVAATKTTQQALDQVKQAQTRLIALTQAADQLQDHLVQQRTAVQRAQTQVDQLTAQLAAQRDQLPEDAPTFAAFAEQEQRVNQQLTTGQAQWQAAVDHVAATKQAVTVAQTEAQSAQTELAQSHQQVTTARQAMDQILANHQLDWAKDEAQVAEQLAALPTLTQKRQTLQNFRSQQERLTATITELTKRIGDQPEPDREQTQAALAAVHQQVAQLQDQRYAYQSQWQHNDQLVTTLNQQLADHAVAMQATQDLEELAGVLNGDGPNSRIGLERYVLQTYLRQILRVGNQRLQNLTNGRYQFVIDETPAASKKRSGLEIDVYDDHVGEQRSVHTLSGGESFIAALALALALGEVIQRTTGSVDVDALFIDEGFGSLDEDALMTALESLESVEGQHRMIGIISHVSELQTQVPNQLQVISNGNGESHVRYRTLADL